jgi:flagellar motor switch protein FliN/FliY
VTESTLPQPRAYESDGGVPDAMKSDVSVPNLPDFGPTAGARGQAGRDISLLADIPVQVAVEIGRVKLPLRDLLNLEPGAILELDRAADAPVDVLVNGRLVAHGEVVVIAGEFAVRVTDIVDGPA